MVARWGGRMKIWFTLQVVALGCLACTQVGDAGGLDVANGGGMSCGSLGPSHQCLEADQTEGTCHNEECPDGRGYFQCVPWTSGDDPEYGWQTGCINIGSGVGCNEGDLYPCDPTTGGDGYQVCGQEACNSCDEALARGECPELCVPSVPDGCGDLNYCECVIDGGNAQEQAGRCPVGDGSWVDQESFECGPDGQSRVCRGTDSGGQGTWQTISVAPEDCARCGGGETCGCFRWDNENSCTSLEGGGSGGSGGSGGGSGGSGGTCASGNVEGTTFSNEGYDCTTGCNGFVSDGACVIHSGQILRCDCNNQQWVEQCQVGGCSIASDDGSL